MQPRKCQVLMEAASANFMFGVFLKEFVVFWCPSARNILEN